MTKTIMIALQSTGILLSGVGAYMTSGKYGVQDNNMVLANVEALSQDADGDDDGDMPNHITPAGNVRVRAEKLQPCWLSHKTPTKCLNGNHPKSCKAYSIHWEVDHTMYRCFDMDEDRFRKETQWTAAGTLDEYCSGVISSSAPGKNKVIHEY